MRTQGREAYLSLRSHATSILAARVFVFMRSAYFGLQPFARQNGIGSVPSASMIVCSALVTESTWAVLFGIAQYIPANAKTVSRISTDLFIGGASEARISVRREVYAQ
jgi:hypothetical protein